jgi:hypothetical protein
MTTAYTSLLGLALPVDGELTGTWGQVVNNYITTYLDGAIAGTQIISGSQTAVTLSKTTGTTLIQVGSGATGSSQYQVIKCSGAPASLLTVTVPSAEKTYLVINATSTSQSVKIVGASGTGVTIASGKTSIVAWNGSDFVEISPSTATTATTATTAAAANGINSATTTVVLNSATAPTIGQVLTATSGTAATWQTPSASGVTSVTATSPVASTGGTTPVISMPAATTSVSGYLTNTDWNTFNGKLSTTGGTMTGAITFAAGQSFTGTLPLTGGTMTGNLTLDAYTEKVATLATSGTIALNPSTGTTLSCAAAGTVTFTDSLSSGQSISLLLTNGSSYTINWPTTTWVTAAGNTAPTLSASNTLVFWKISTTLYGALVGKSA